MSVLQKGTNEVEIHENKKVLFVPDHLFYVL